MIFLTPAPLSRDAMELNRNHGGYVIDVSATLPRIGAGYSPARRPDNSPAKVERGVRDSNLISFVNSL